MVKVLQLSTKGLKYDGITNVIYNYCGNINNIDFSFLSFKNNPIKIVNKFKLVGNVIEAPNRKKIISYLIFLFKLQKKNKYDIIHIHGNSATMVIDAIIFKILGVKKIIAHCHNTNCDHHIINKLLKPFINIFFTHYLACSNQAGNWLYKKKFTVLNNAIEIEKFKYNENIRKKIRKGLKIKDTDLVIGNVANFTEQKNHKFILEIFSEINKKNKTSKLLLIGDGHLKEEIELYAKKLNIYNNIIFLGHQENVFEYYQAMDVFLFPSLWEGLGIVLIEAQLSGLKCFTSNTVPKDVVISNLIKFIDLDITSNTWSETILKALPYKRGETKINYKNFDIKNESKKLYNIYIKK